MSLVSRYPYSRTPYVNYMHTKLYSERTCMYNVQSLDGLAGPLWMYIIQEGWGELWVCKARISSGVTRRGTLIAIDPHPPFETSIFPKPTNQPLIRDQNTASATHSWKFEFILTPILSTSPLCIPSFFWSAVTLSLSYFLLSSSSRSVDRPIFHCVRNYLVVSRRRYPSRRSYSTATFVNQR